MKLTSREMEKLMIVVAADLARRRHGRGLKLNYPESIAIITYEVLEGARDGLGVNELWSYHSIKRRCNGRCGGDDTGYSSGSNFSRWNKACDCTRPH
jgi:hypothetical protein